MNPSLPQTKPALPLPIFQISQKVERYLLYDIDTITWLRKTHNILGVLIGSLPQVPQQNVFLGLPLELQPEEARLLVDQGLAYIVDDLERHTRELASQDVTQKDDVRARLRMEGMQIARDIERRKKHKHQLALKRMQDRRSVMSNGPVGSNPSPGSAEDPPEESLFGEPLTQENTTAVSSSTRGSDSDLQPYAVTPTPYKLASSYRQHEPVLIPRVNHSSYALFQHLHSLGYFMLPGLRFGCQFSVYPGDPLRFHGHFLATGLDWDEEIDLLHLIGGGRLGTGVKKGWLIGGTEKDSAADSTDPELVVLAHDEDTRGKSPQVRTFCIEWGGM